VGSALVQYTFVVGLFPLIVAVLVISRRQVIPVSVLTMLALGLSVFVVADGWLSRGEGALLIGFWIVALLVILRLTPGFVHDAPPVVRHQGRLRQAGIVLAALAFVGLGATVAVEALLRVADSLGVPEYLLGFFGASIGTSAPELIVDLTAVARGAPAIAFGDAFGSSLVDSSLTIGLGGVVAPAEVTPRLAVVGSIYSLVAIGVVGAMLSVRERHDRVSGATFVGLYALAYVVLILAD
jgi:cation:H+ antiporter